MNGRGGGDIAQSDAEPRVVHVTGTQTDLLLFLELQKPGFDLRLGVLQRGSGQRGVGRQVGHGGRHLRDAASQLLPGQQGGGRRAVAAGGGDVRHIHGGTAGHGHGGGGLQRSPLARHLAFIERRLRLHFQGGSEVETGRWKHVFMVISEAGKGGRGLCSDHGPVRHSLSVFYGPVHSAEERAAVLHQAVKVHLLQEVALSLAEVICVEPVIQTEDDVNTPRTSSCERSSKKRKKKV